MNTSGFLGSPIAQAIQYCLGLNLEPIVYNTYSILNTPRE